ncbi:uncharacterized protein ACHE_60282A [Aspergillus chevalieri]|uniref:Nudix hydrolase domain-containing protein n=1 Tax=Aspergillus chevalieri TaxID=182096 RepID=A0A7R7ZR60_ASPCH|nr:uncharacterized protein ACHE_60282A [Aspergillus chevalieri]BCR90396.1 hypothetical protein ACHE_60282A [Aspergillus chevalieri]
MASSINSTSVPPGMLPHDPSVAACNVTRGLFDLDSNLSAFRITEPPCRFRFHGITYRIRVSAHVFSWLDDNNNETADSPKPRLLLLQRALCDTQPGCWETWRRFKGREWHEWVGLPYIIEVSKRATSQDVPQPVMEWEDAIRLNPEEHQAFTWATEDEVRSGKYKMFGNHKEAILEAFATVTQNRSV